MEKIIQIVVSEIIEALIFLILIISLASLSTEFPLLAQLIPIFLWGWVIIGIATPMIIFTELGDYILDSFSRMK